MSLWQIDDKATATIITDFYKPLAQKAIKSNALQQAKLTYLEHADPATAHTYY